MNINFNDISDVELFGILTEGYSLSDVLAGNYAELVELLGVHNALKLFKHFHGCKINCPKHLYKPEFIIGRASMIKDRRQREQLAILCGYTSAWLENRIKNINTS